MYCNNFLLVVTSYLMDKEINSICFTCKTYFPTSQYDMHAKCIVPLDVTLKKNFF